MEYPEVTLTIHEMYSAGLVGFRRQLESIHKNRAPRFKEKVAGELFGKHILAAMSEMAVAKYLNIHWGAHVNSFGKPDVGPYEVRWSMMPKMKVRQRDLGFVISTTGQPPTFTIVGYMDADAAKKKEWSDDFGNGGPPAYFVPHDLLHPILELKR